MMQRKGTKTATSIENAVSIPHTAQMKRGGTKWEKGRIERKNGQNKFSRKYTIWAVTNKHTTMTATRKYCNKIRGRTEKDAATGQPKHIEGSTINSKVYDKKTER